MPSLRRRLAATLASAAACLGLAAGAQAGSAQLNFSGTLNGFHMFSGPLVDQPYDGSFVYDDAASPTAPGQFALTGAVVLGVTLDFGQITLENDVLSGTDTVDRITFLAGTAPGLFMEQHGVQIELTSDFLASVDALPTQADFDAALAGNKILFASGGGAAIFLPFGIMGEYDAEIDAISTGPLTAVPTPAAAAGALPLLGLLAAKRRRRA